MAWEIDAAHSHAGFSVKHMMITTVKGHFNVLRGKLHIDEQNPASSWVEAEIDANSIDTKDAARDNHLRSADFFDVANHPTLSFKSTKVEKTGDDEYNVLGDLTIRGVTKPVVFQAEYNGHTKDPYGNIRSGLNATARIKRKDFGLHWNNLLETGGAVVGDEVKIEIDLEAVNKG